MEKYNQQHHRKIRDTILTGIIAKVHTTLLFIKVLQSTASVPNGRLGAIFGTAVYWNLFLIQLYFFSGFVRLNIFWALFHLVRNLCWFLFVWRKDKIFKQHLCCNFAHSISFASFSYSCDDRSGFSYHTKTYQTLCTGQLWTWCHLARPTITRFCPSVVSSRVSI